MAILFIADILYILCGYKVLTASYLSTFSRPRFHSSPGRTVTGIARLALSIGDILRTTLVPKQHQVADVHDEPHPLPHKEHGVSPMKGIDRQDRPPQEREVPEE